MDVRYSTNQTGLKAMTTEDLRRAYLIDTLFQPDEVPMCYSDVDRSITGSAVPVAKKLQLLSSAKEMAAEYFLERREIGIINIGGDGTVTADGTVYSMKKKDGLYLGRGTKEVFFASAAKASPAKFYFVSYPAHQTYPAVHASFKNAEASPLGSAADANKRTIYRYIHLKGIKSCQLVMGLTELEEGSVWNTMPVHTHLRRSEVYMYFNLSDNGTVFHLMGEPSETRHIVVRNEQAVISPSWSIHSGVGTQNYTFIWAMGGENQVFDDMDHVTMNDLA